MREQELNEQRKAIGLRRGVSYDVATEPRRNLAKRFSRQRAVRDLALISGEPRFANGLFTGRF
jgi:hypothetical protein